LAICYADKFMPAHPARWLCLSALSVFFLCACGTPGAPQPPSLNLARPVSDLKAVRNGGEINFTWTIPAETTDGAAFRHRGSTKVCQAVNKPQVDQCSAILTLPTPKQKTATATTALPLGSNDPNDFVTYAVEVDNDRGKNAGLSNQVQVPTAFVTRLNAAPSSQVTADAVLVTANITPENESVQQALELRRKEKGTPQESPVARRDLPAGDAGNVELRDETFVWEKTYEYRVVVVASATVPNGSTVTFNAASSAPFEVFTHDVFPPAVPSGLEAVYSGQIAGQPSSIDLTWSPDSDRDLAGYFIYRRRQDEPASAAVKLNAQPVAAPAYRDASIQPGTTYVYSVSAVDERGNESQRSEEASEEVPK
jgi:hypothetical protein